MSWHGCYWSRKSTECDDHAFILATLCNVRWDTNALRLALVGWPGRKMRIGAPPTMEVSPAVTDRLKGATHCRVNGASKRCSF